MEQRQGTWERQRQQTKGSAGSWAGVFCPGWGGACQCSVPEIGLLFSVTCQVPVFRFLYNLLYLRDWIWLMEQKWSDVCDFQAWPIKSTRLWPSLFLLPVAEWVTLVSMHLSQLSFSQPSRHWPAALLFLASMCWLTWNHLVLGVEKEMNFLFRGSLNSCDSSKVYPRL